MLRRRLSGLNLEKCTGWLNLEKISGLILTWILTGPFYRYRLIPQQSKSSVLSISKDVFASAAVDSCGAALELTSRAQARRCRHCAPRRDQRALPSPGQPSLNQEILLYKVMMHFSWLFCHFSVTQLCSVCTKLYILVLFFNFLSLGGWYGVYF